MAIEPARKPRQKHQPQAPKTESWRDWLIDISSLSLDGIEYSRANVDPPKPRRALTEDEVEAFWKKCDENAGPGREPEWEEHLKTLHEARTRGLPDV